MTACCIYHMNSGSKYLFLRQFQSYFVDRGIYWEFVQEDSNITLRGRALIVVGSGYFAEGRGWRMRDC
jgi:hypothetical protein